MEIHQLRYFIAVAETGSFTGAARECNVSQPSLSAQVAKLEEELGGPLVERNRRGCRLSSRGELLLPRAREVLRQLEAANRELADFDQALGGNIRLGCLPTTGAYVLPPLLKEYRSRYPDVSIRLSEGSSPVLADALLDHQVELAIMDQAGLKDGLEGELLFTEPLYIALPPDHPLAAAGSVPEDGLDIGLLEGQPLILMRRGHGFNRIVNDALSAAGVTPDIVYESSEIETVQALVRAGLGISIVPRMICVHNDISYRSFSGTQAVPSRSLLMVHRSGALLSPAADRLIDLAKTSLREIFDYTVNGNK